MWVQQELSASGIGGEQDSVTGHQQAAPLQPDGEAEVAVGADPYRSVQVFDGEDPVEGTWAPRDAPPGTPVMVEPLDISNAVLWLASGEARYVTGVTLPVDMPAC